VGSKRSKLKSEVSLIGGSGGSKIISSTLQAILNVLAFNEDISTAIQSPRLYFQLIPGVFSIEPGFSTNITKYLQSLGHQISLDTTASVSAVQGIMQDNLGILYAASDLRKQGQPAGY